MMAKRLGIVYDPDLIEQIASDFNLRRPNKVALKRLVQRVDEGEYDPAVMQVMNLATGVGKTYLMAAFMEYLRVQGVANVVIVTPGKVVQAKTRQNFTQGTGRYIVGAAVPPEVVTPQDYSAWVARMNGPAAMSFGREVPMLAFVFNIQQLIAPRSLEGTTYGSKAGAQQRRPRRFDESAGVLFDYLKDLDDLVVIADESHLYSESAAAFNAALRELDPALSVGLTASPLPGDEIVYAYPLYQAIADEYVKRPVLAFRKEGYADDMTSEEQQLHDAVQLREIKQRVYDQYADASGKRRIKAVLFVVCADTDHATQVTGLLRTQRYFGNSISVLQVDSNHDDETTQRLLENVDEPDSPVLAVVSVNKLKEGWDVKNIGVVVTLRAMASEVLTQQTMGRGLRLPFGKYTGVSYIDQLDIIAHQSFEELLRAENVLEQFGLEEAVSDEGKAQFEATVQGVAGGLRVAGTGAAMPVGGVDANPTDVGAPPVSGAGAVGLIPPEGSAAGAPAAGGVAASSGTLWGASDGSDVNGQASSLFGGSSVGVRAIADGSDNQPGLAFITVGRNPRFADVEYVFPSTRVDMVDPKVHINDMRKHDIEAAARRVTSTGDVLFRKEIVAAVGKKRLGVADTTSAEVDSLSVDVDVVEAALVKLVLSNHLIPPTAKNITLVRKYLVKTFMENVTFEEWTMKSLDSAHRELRTLTQNFVDEVLRGRKENTVVVPRRMPATDALIVSYGDGVHDPVDNSFDFKRNRFYRGWTNSLFECESFDSYTGEFLLAKLLLTSPHIVWWQRLHVSDNARIAYTAKDNYYPDFVAYDDAGVYWIIEGKSQAGVNDEAVQLKRRAAEALLPQLLVEDDFEGQRWGYLIAYEDDIKSSDSWDDLKAKSQPVCM